MDNALKYFITILIVLSSGLSAQQTPYSSYALTKYGSAINALALTPYHMQDNEMVSFRFRSLHTGSLTGIRVYIMGRTYGNTGYGAGNGGTWQISLRGDSTASHTPKVGWLASMTRNHIADSVGSAQTPFPLLSFGSSYAIDSNTVYHVVFQNTDASPATNYTALNCLTMWPQSGLSPFQPFSSDADWCSLYSTSPFTSWNVNLDPDVETPIMEYYYADGRSYGMTYMETEDPKTIGSDGNYKLRETITVSGGDRVTTGASVWLEKVSGSGALSVRLEDGAGTEIETQTIAAAGITAANYAWYSVTWASSHTLSNTSSYHLVLSAPNGTSYQTYPIRKDANYSLSANTMFADGWSQYTTNGSSYSDWQGSSTGTHGYDLMFYFTTTGTPTINISTSSLSFGNQTINTTSAEQTFTVSGTNLTADITVSAPSGFEVSKTTSTGFGSSVTCTQSGGTVGTTTIYVHFIPTLAQAYSGNVASTSTGATEKDVAVTGTGIAVVSTKTLTPFRFK